MSSSAGGLRGPYIDSSYYSSYYRNEENVKTDANQYENLKKEYVHFFSPISSFFRIISEYIMRGLKSIFSIFNLSSGDEMVQTYPLGMYHYAYMFVDMYILYMNIYVFIYIYIYIYKYLYTCVNRYKFFNHRKQVMGMHISYHDMYIYVCIYSCICICMDIIITIIIIIVTILIIIIGTKFHYRKQVMGLHKYTNIVPICT
jgi:hypothetical protein